MNARKKEITTEKHLKSIGEREAGRLKQENQRLAFELQKLKDKRNTCEVGPEIQIFIQKSRFILRIKIIVSE